MAGKIVSLDAHSSSAASYLPTTRQPLKTPQDFIKIIADEPSHGEYRQILFNEVTVETVALPANKVRY